MIYLIITIITICSYQIGFRFAKSTCISSSLITILIEMEIIHCPKFGNFLLVFHAYKFKFSYA